MAEDSITLKIIRLVADIDFLISRQLECVCANETLKSLRATWSGLHWLVQSRPPQNDVQIKILDLSEAELMRDIHQSANLYQTMVFKRIYDETLCSLGGDPFGMVLFDFYFDFLTGLTPEQAEITLLMSEMGELSKCPVVMGLSDGWMQANMSLAFMPARLERLLQSEEFSRFRRIRKKGLSDFLAVTWPCFTTAEYQKEGVLLHGGYGLVALVLREFALYGWFSGLLAWGEGVKAGAVLPDQSGKPLAELKLTESLESAYADLGIMPISSAWLDNTAGFFVMPMAGSSPNEEKDRQSLPPLLILCRFAHYLKVMIRDQIGILNTPDEFTSFLQGWLNNYCSQTDISDIAYLASYPLKWAKIQVYEGQEPGKYLANLALLPNLPVGLAKAELTIRLQLSPES